MGTYFFGKINEPPSYTSKLSGSARQAFDYRGPPRGESEQSFRTQQCT